MLSLAEWAIKLTKKFNIESNRNNNHYRNAKFIITWKLAKAVKSKHIPESAVKAVKMFKNAAISSGSNTYHRQLIRSENRGK